MGLKDIFFNELELKSDKWMPYFKVYEQYLSKFIGKAPVVLEIGVQGGGSIEMWRKFFGEDAIIYGVEADPEVIKKLQGKYDDNTKIVQGDQGDFNFWKEFLAKVPAIDIIIDDGGHIMHQQISTLYYTFPFLKSGGVYICEDTHTSYMYPYGGGLYRNESFLEFVKKITDSINYDYVEQIDRTRRSDDYLEVFKDLYSVSFLKSMVVLTKEILEPFERGVVNDDDTIEN